MVSHANSRAGKEVAVVVVVVVKRRREASYESKAQRRPAWHTRVFFVIRARNKTPHTRIVVFVVARGRKEKSSAPS